jgi:hypothetical protein
MRRGGQVAAFRSTRRTAFLVFTNQETFFHAQDYRF